MVNLVVRAALVLLACTGLSNASAQIRVAVASNFTQASQELASGFSELGYTKPVLLFASTGKHVAQIQRGLSADILLAADSNRSKYLEQNGVVVCDACKQVYAVGRLAFWRPNQPFIKVGLDREPSLTSAIGELDGALALANPELAPYGAAAKEVLDTLSKYISPKVKVVKGDNVSQVFHFVASGNAQAGFIAQSQVISLPQDEYLLVSSTLHAPIEQEMVLLNSSDEAKAFFNFVLSSKGMEIIRQHGYDTP